MRHDKTISEGLPADGRPIFLTGMPAAGKTYWGEKIAAHYGWKFTDLDVLIELREGRDITGIFAAYGEDGFRQREREGLVAAIAGGQRHIIACGGGTPCYHNNMALMKAAGVVVYLQADMEELLQHLADSTDARPLLHAAGDVAQKLATMLAERKVVYEQADIILPTKDISISSFAKIVAQCINGQ